jgi:hypothetical protein
VSANLLDPVRPAFRALAEIFIPETAQAAPATWLRLEHVVVGVLAGRPAAMRRQVLLFIRILDLLARVRHGRGLGALDPIRRTRLITSVGGSRWLLLRRGVWGLRTLVQMGYYTQPEVQAELGYRATRAGWEARR